MRYFTSPFFKWSISMCIPSEYEDKLLGLYELGRFEADLLSASLLLASP